MSTKNDNNDVLNNFSHNSIKEESKMGMKKARHLTELWRHFN